jgi:hypothetical protein
MRRGDILVSDRSLLSSRKMNGGIRRSPGLRIADLAKPGAHHIRQARSRQLADEQITDAVKRQAALPLG